MGTVTRQAHYSTSRTTVGSEICGTRSNGIVVRSGEVRKGQRRLVISNGSAPVKFSPVRPVSTSASEHPVSWMTDKTAFGYGVIRTMELAMTLSTILANPGSQI